MSKLVLGGVVAALVLGAQAVSAGTVTNIDISSDYNGSWSGEINGGNIAAGAESGTGNASSGLSFSDPTGQFVAIGPGGSTTFGSLSIALTGDSVVNSLFNLFYGTSPEEGVVTFTNSSGQTASYELIANATIRDYNDNVYADGLSGANPSPGTQGDVTAVDWWYDLTGGTFSPGTLSDPSSRLDAQTFYLPSSWAGTDLTSVAISNTSSGDSLVLSALEADTTATTPPPPPGVPEPGSLALFGGALAAIAAMRRRTRS
jgi:hypothetical protein